VLLLALVEKHLVEKHLAEKHLPKKQHLVR
jgi:hypothetical protein